mgnify:CR=1 FL=1
MEGLGWILTIIVGAIAGWIAEKIMKAMSLAVVGADADSRDDDLLVAC